MNKMTRCSPGDETSQSERAIKDPVKELLEIWVECNRDLVEFCRRINGAEL